MAKFDTLGNRIEDIATEWDGHSGMEVEDFICRKLEQANIVSAVYDGGTSMLDLNKEDGSKLQVEISVIEPEYNYGIMLYGVRVDGGTIYTEANNTLLTSYVPGKKIELGVVLYATVTTSQTLDRVGNFDLKIQFGSKSGIYKASTVPYDSCIINNGVITGTTMAIEEIAWVDISDLFVQSQKNVQISAVVQNDTEVKDTLELSITNDVISLSYTGEIIVNQNQVNFSLAGASDQSLYQLQGFNNGVAVSSSSMSYSGLTPGLNQIVIRAVHSQNSSIFTDWCYVDLIYTENCVNSVVAVNGVSSGISNNGIATLYKLTVYSPKQEEVSLTTYLEDVVPTSLNPTQVIKQEILSASSYDDNNVYDTNYTKYIEITSDSASKYLLVKVDDQFYNFPLVTTNLGGDLITSNLKYKKMTIESSINELTYYKDTPPNLNYDQIVGYSNNVFVTEAYATETTPANISTDLESSDGWNEESGRSFFKVSAQDNAVFSSELDLKLTETFTIELGVKTYNISNENTSILTFGNLELRPTQVCWRYDDEEGANKTAFNSRNAQFQEDQETHILITCKKGYYIDKNDIYYPDYLGAVDSSHQTAFDAVSDSTKFNLVRIYINGVIDREFELSDVDLKSLIANKVQIKSTTADINFYLFRVYNNVALDFNQVQRNYISFMPTKSEKVAFYDKNDILFEDGDRKGEISFAKTLGKYNSIVQIYPKSVDGNRARFPHRFWGGQDGDANSKVDSKISSTMFINYADDAKNKKYGGRLTHGQVKGQGSSAMRYLIWNVTFALGKFKDESGEKIKSKFIPYNQMNTETNRFVDGAEPTIKNGYIMPPYEGQVDTNEYPVKKLVGKVNFASSMQSHKVGACKLFDDAYRNTVSKQLPSGGKKAVHQEAFLYFYWETDSLEYNPADPDNSSIATVDLADLLENNESIKFMGFQTWGAGKGDDAESGFDEDVTPEYLMLEGGENNDPTVNFRVPWHALQRGSETYYNSKLETYPTISKDDSLAHPDWNLWIDDESIVYNAKGAWDIDYGVYEEEDVGFRFEDGLSGDVEVNGKTYTLGESERNVIDSLKKFREFYDFVYTYDYTGVVTGETAPSTSWNTDSKYIVTAGTFYINEEQVLNHQSGDVYRFDVITNSWIPAGLYYNNGWERLNVYELGQSDNMDTALANMQLIFKGYTNSPYPKVGDYVDENDISFHQAFIKLISGTDNRAKNTYFQIIGPFYEEQTVVDESGNPVLNDEGEPKTEFVKGSSGDYKIRLIGDDLDTIFVTDNNGLQSKPYNLVEASFDPSHKVHWGDANNVFFVMYDQTHESDIKTKLKGIIDTTGASSDKINNTGTYLYNAFFSVQETLPAIAYNHTAKIYYESAFAIRQANIFADYKNNDVNALSQSHGSCLQCEKQFMKKRLNFLNTYALTQLGDGFPTASSAGSGNPVKWRIEFEPYQDFYPCYWFESGVNYYLGELDASSKYDIGKYLAKEGQSYSVDVIQQVNAINQGLYRPDLYKSFNMSGLVYTTELSANFNRTIDFTINNKLADFGTTSFTKFTPKFPVIENLTLNNMTLPALLDFSEYKKLKTLSLSKTTTQQVIFPETGRLESITLPETITAFKIYNNPGLKTVKFEGTANLSDVYIDCSKCGAFDVEQFCVTLTSCLGLQSVTIRNANGLNLTEDTLLFLLSIQNCQLSGTFNIVTDLESLELKTISFTTKQQLVNKFGNIEDSNNETVFNYTSSIVQSISVPSEVYVYATANESIPLTKANLFPISISSGNDVQIVSGVNPFDVNVNGYLNITYSIESNQFATIDTNTGTITLEEAGSSKEDKADVTISVYTANSIKPIVATSTVYFTWIAPQLGDFAYADGSFSSGYDKNKTMVGLVYARKFSNTDETAGTAYIIGSEYLPDVNGETTSRITGYGNEFMGSSTTTDSKQLEMQAVRNYLLELGVISSISEDDYAEVSGVSDVSISDKNNIVDFYINQTNDVITTNITDYEFNDATEQIYSLKYFTGKEDTLKYVDHVNTKLLKQLYYYNNGLYKSYLSVKDDVCYIDSTDNLDKLSRALSNNFTNNTNNYIQSILFPYFYAFNLYQPSVKENEILHDQYKQGNWYAPSMSEMMRILYYRDYSVNGSISGALSTSVKSDVTSGDTPETTPIFSLAYKRSEMNLDVWNNILDSGYMITTTISTSVNENYTFWKYSNNYNWVPGTNDSSNYQNYYKGKQAHRYNFRKGVPFVQFNFSKE